MSGISSISCTKSIRYAAVLAVAGFSSLAFAQVEAPIGQPAHRIPRNGGVMYPGSQQPGQPLAAPQQAKASATVPATDSSNTTAPGGENGSTQAVPASLLQQPPKQAEIVSAGNNLTIKADNASLTQTLQRIADKTGMHIEGISGDQRVFGDFGPGAPRDVLTTLLTGTGYNIVMVGSLDNGAPRQLLLSQKKAATSGPAPFQGQGQDQQQSSPDDDVQDSPSDDQPSAQQMVPPQRGADAMNGARTPQQMLQRLRDMQETRQSQSDLPPGTPTPQQ